MAPRDLLHTVRATLERHGLLVRGDRVVVALSGGADSSALLLALYELRAEYELSLRAAHLDHQLRGPAGEADATFCHALCERLGVPFTLGVEAVAGRAEKAGLSLEQAGREARYEFLERVRDETGAQRVAVGHTLEDVTETFFLNLFRGSGLDGLCSLPPQRHGAVIRPLLGCTHQDTQAFCRAREVEWREDATNADQRFARNRVRRRLLPLVREEFCPDLDSRVGQLVELLRADRSVLDAAAEELLQRATQSDRGDELTLAAQVLREAPGALASRALRLAVARVRGSRHNVSRAHVEQCLALISSSGGSAEAQLPGVSCFYEPPGTLRVVASASADRARGTPGSECRIPLAVPGRTQAPALNLAVTAELLPRQQVELDTANAHQVYLDAAAAGASLVLRTARPGDRFRPLGLGGTKKLQDFFTDLKLPPRQRWSTPVLDNGRHLVWVVGYRLDHRVRVTPETEQVLRLHVEPQSPARSDG